MDKTYVRVLAEFSEDGAITPVRLYWEGVPFDIDRVLDVRPAASLKHGGQGDRYTIRIRGQIRYLFLERGVITEGLGRWFVETP